MNIFPCQGICLMITVLQMAQLPNIKVCGASLEFFMLLFFCCRLELAREPKAQVIL